MTTRRDFFKKATFGSALALTIPQIVTSAYASEKPKKINLSNEDIILFQGDSITDAGRNKEETSFNNPRALGSGYAFMAGADLLFHHPEKNLKIYNKGISGNKVYQLAERWEQDCLNIKPNVLSILIGVNDFWHTLNGNYKGTIKTYSEDLTALLQRTKQQLPNVKMIIGEPFAVSGIKAVDEKWYPDFDEYRRASKEIAENLGATFIPYQTIFNEAQKSAPGAYWTHDGVHPSIAGARLMANAWLQAVK